MAAKKKKKTKTTVPPTTLRTASKAALPSSRPPDFYTARTVAPPPPRSAHGSERFAWARSLIRDVPDFPKPGILFKDITTLLAVPRAFHMVLDGIAERFIGDHVDAIVGIE